MKKIQFLCIVMVFMLVLSSVCIAQTTTPTDSKTLEKQQKDKKSEQAPDYFTKAYQNEVEKVNQKIDNYIIEKSSMMTTQSGGGRTLSVPLYKQTTSYYCGPASGQMVIDFVDNTLYTQSTLATDMGTTQADGTYVYRLTNTLNNKIGPSTYQYVLTSSSSFGNSLIYSIDNNKPIVCHVDTEMLPAYGGYSTGHYIVSIGYEWYAVASTGYSKVTYNDPNNNTSYYGTYTCDVTDMENAINANAGYYIRPY